jgi:hypothetical protein
MSAALEALGLAHHISKAAALDFEKSEIREEFIARDHAKLFPRGNGFASCR